MLAEIRGPSIGLRKKLPNWLREKVKYYLGESKGKYVSSPRDLPNSVIITELFHRYQ
jgi:hypothetical protein